MVLDGAAKLLTAHLGVRACIDYRGFGDSTGSPSEAGLNADAEAALAWLAERGVAPSQVLVWGHSLGTGPALHLASSLELSERPLHGVVLEAPYTSLIDAAVTFPSAFLIRALPFGHYIIRRYFYYQWHNFRILPHLWSTRVLVLHGTHDLIVPFVHTVELARQVAFARRRAGIVCETARADDDPERAPRAQCTSREMLHETRPQVEIVPLLGAGHLNCLFQPPLLQALSRFACFPYPRAARSGHNAWGRRRDCVPQKVRARCSCSISTCAKDLASGTCGMCSYHNPHHNSSRKDWLKTHPPFYSLLDSPFGAPAPGGRHHSSRARLWLPRGGQ